MPDEAGNTNFSRMRMHDATEVVDCCVLPFDKLFGVYSFQDDPALSRNFAIVIRFVIVTFNFATRMKLLFASNLATELLMLPHSRLNLLFASQKGITPKMFHFVFFFSRHRVIRRRSFLAQIK
jgi:hypothetical protein